MGSNFLHVQIGNSGLVCIQPGNIRLNFSSQTSPVFSLFYSLPSPLFSFTFFFLLYINPTSLLYLSHISNLSLPPHTSLSFLTNSCLFVKYSNKPELRRGFMKKVYLSLVCNLIVIQNSYSDVLTFIHRSTYINIYIKNNLSGSLYTH